MNIKQTMIKALKHTKWVAPQNVDEEKWYEACDKAIKLVEQLKEPDETKMNLKDLERANILVQNVKILEILSKSEIEYLNVKYPNGRHDSVFIKDELKEKIQKVFEDYADELKAELKELGVDYE
ncbi:hypothetical protein SAMN05216392_0791 [Streptococcus equinus]|uniref:Uncharacterized protein n=1 Tax=Streptococcus equinus TaxID=1335 RepID=A0A1H0YPN6_STREI|nr:hypothetical protein [Streptococcus equinus]QBX15785.1 hypothetical protein Javan213_0037 [Streptococcus phage Javan213]SDQ17090.1 hypothetical protein SAMN05216392_0791 [Streptococcus equinus]